VVAKPSTAAAHRVFIHKKKPSGGSGGVTASSTSRLIKSQLAVVLKDIATRTAPLSALVSGKAKQPSAPAGDKPHKATKDRLQSLSQSRSLFHPLPFLLWLVRSLCDVTASDLHLRVFIRGEREQTRCGETASVPITSIATSRS
jgi:hypothetical protein